MISLPHQPVLGLNCLTTSSVGQELEQDTIFVYSEHTGA